MNSYSLVTKLMFLVTMPYYLANYRKCFKKKRSLIGDKIISELA